VFSLRPASFRGAADPARGSGLLGLKDRTEALGGKISLRSLPGVGTSLQVELPVNDQNEESLEAFAQLRAS
jgi:signal transduction histidine kinase